MSKPINVAVLGAGMSLNVFHRPSIIFHKDKFNLHTVLERSGAGKAKQLCGDQIKIVTSLEQILADPEVDLVVVSTPNNTHFPFAKQAIEAGKHVLLEKPMCVTAADGEELAKLAEEKGVILSVYQNRRWDADFLTVKSLIESERLGAIIDFTSNYDRYRPVGVGRAPGSTWKESPGQHNDVIYNLGSHIIDQVYVLFGMPQKVACRFSDVRSMGVDEGFHMDLFYPEFVATVQASILSALPHQQRFLIRGTRGSYFKQGHDPQETHLKDVGSSNTVRDDYGVEPESAWGTLYEARAPTNGETSETTADGVAFVTSKYPSAKGEYNALYTNLYDAISSKDPSKLIVKPSQAIDVLRIIELGQKAAKEDRIVSV